MLNEPGAASAAPNHSTFNIEHSTFASSPERVGVFLVTEGSFRSWRLLWERRKMRVGAADAHFPRFPQRFWRLAPREPNVRTRNRRSKSRRNVMKSQALPLQETGRHPQILSRTRTFNIRHSTFA